MDKLTDRQLERYSRQLILPQIDFLGQERLNLQSVLIVGAGGLGGPIAQYLTGAGVGKIRVVDPDLVELSNLHRQTVFGEEDIGRNKSECLAARLSAMNSDVTVEHYCEAFEISNSEDLLKGIVLVVDATDSRSARLKIDRATFEHGLPWIMGAAVRTAGQLCAFDSKRRHGCYHCLQDNITGTETTGCADTGILGPVVGIIALYQTVFALKYLLGAEIPWGKLFYHDVWGGVHTKIKMTRVSDCVLCCEAN